MKSVFQHKYNEIISLDNILLAWQEFLLGKFNKQDVQEFSLHLMDNILSLHQDLKNYTYQHGTYEDFYVNDPKRRHINKATVRDRLLHHAVYRQLYPFFDKTFISDSFSCRKDKGTHKALNRFKAMIYTVSKNHTHTCWVLKCDIRKFFDSINHQILLNILSQHINDQDIINLLNNIIESYNSEIYGKGTDLPLGNLTSQLFANVYLNTFDQWIKHNLKFKHYVRYADDFVFLSTDKKYLESLIPKIQQFLSTQLKLTLHPDKLFIKTLASGVDFLGWVHFSNHRVLRGVTRKRAFNRIKVHSTNETLQSYLGMLKHGNGHKIREELLNEHWVSDISSEF